MGGSASGSGVCLNSAISSGLKLAHQGSHSQEWRSPSLFGVPNFSSTWIAPTLRGSSPPHRLSSSMKHESRFMKIHSIGSDSLRLCGSSTNQIERSGSAQIASRTSGSVIIMRESSSKQRHLIVARMHSFFVSFVPLFSSTVFMLHLFLSHQVGTVPSVVLTWRNIGRVTGGARARKIPRAFC